VAGTRPWPGEVAEATTRHLGAADAAVPGLVHGLYVTGSVALGHYRPGRSDIDFVAFMSRPAGPADVAALGLLHGTLTATADYDGFYVASEELPRVPMDERPAPHILGGHFSDDACHELTPSTWTEFSRYAIAVLGPAAGDLGISIPAWRLRERNLGNLNSYWSGQVSAGRRLLSGRSQSDLVDPATVAWTTLGAARLHFTLATGDITSKSGAGRYAAGRFHDFADLIEAAMAWRATGAGEFTVADAYRSGDLVLAIVADANRRWGS
jgi:Nucleotidyltransferase domain